MDSIVMEWVRHRAPHAMNGWEKYSAIGISDGDKLIGGVVYHNYHGHSIEMSIATESPKWASKKTIAALFRYPFIQLGCERVTATTGITNIKAQSLLTRLGFTHEGLIRKGYPGEDMLIYGMLHNECRWIK